MDIGYCRQESRYVVASLQYNPLSRHVSLQYLLILAAQLDLCVNPPPAQIKSHARGG
jgi:hypothetical protein